MADRTAAALFRDIFEMLAMDPKQNRALAHRIWPKRLDYDFSDYQLECDEALIALGLARLDVDQDYPEEGEVVLYGPESPNTSSDQVSEPEELYVREFQAFRKAMAADAAYHAAVGDSAWARGNHRAAQYNWASAGNLYSQAIDAELGDEDK